MRTGVLSDESALQTFAPHTQDIHDTYMAKPHLHKHGMEFKKPRSDRYKPPARPRAPYMALREYAQIMNPLNPNKFVEAFGERLDAAKTYQPPKSFQGVVEKYNQDNPSYSTTLGVKQETAYFMEQLNQYGYFIDPDDLFLTKSMNVSKTKMQKPLHKIYETLHNSEIGRGDAELIQKMNEVFEEAMAHITPPIPKNVNLGSGLSSANATRTPSRSREVSPSRSPSPGRGPQPRRTRANPSPIIEEQT